MYRLKGTLIYKDGKRINDIFAIPDATDDYISLFDDLTSEYSYRDVECSELDKLTYEIPANPGRIVFVFYINKSLIVYDKFCTNKTIADYISVPYVTEKELERKIEDVMPRAEV
jgi:hypothetical protein